MATLTTKNIEYLEDTLSKLDKEKLILIAIANVQLYQDLKDEHEALQAVNAHTEKWKNHHLDTIDIYHEYQKDKESGSQHISIIYEREEPVIDMFAIQSMLDSMNLTKRTREVLQVVNDLGSQEKASEHLGISQQAVSKHITIAKKEAERLYRL